MQPAVRPLDGHDFFEEEPRCDVEGCDEFATHVKGDTADPDYELLCDEHA